MSKKSLLDHAADTFVDTLRKTAAETGAKIVRHIAKGAGEIAADLEREALCTCSPLAEVTVARGGRSRTKLVHEKGCPAT